MKISVFHERGAAINISSISPLQIFSKSTAIHVRRGEWREVMLSRRDKDGKERQIYIT